MAQASPVLEIIYISSDDEDEAITDKSVKESDCRDLNPPDRLQPAAAVKPLQPVHSGVDCVRLTGGLEINSQRTSFLETSCSHKACTDIGNVLFEAKLKDFVEDHRGSGNDHATEEGNFHDILERFDLGKYNDDDGHSDTEYVDDDSGHSESNDSSNHSHDTLDESKDAHNDSDDALDDNEDVCNGRNDGPDQSEDSHHESGDALDERDNVNNESNGNPEESERVNNKGMGPDSNTPQELGDDGLSTHQLEFLHQWNTADLSQTQVRDEFRERLRVTESNNDLKLLYPPSLQRLDVTCQITDEHAILLKMLDVKASTDVFHVTNNSSLGLDIKCHKVDLSEFCVYNWLGHTYFPGQFESPHNITSNRGKGRYLLDGVVKYNSERLTMHGAEIVKVNIHGLKTGNHASDNSVWIQTRTSHGFGVWYKLENPTVTYQDIWVRFRWVVDFARYCADFISVMEIKKQCVALNHFRTEFMDFMEQSYKDDLSFQRWKQAIAPTIDLRRHIAEFGRFVYDQFYDAEIGTSHQVCPPTHPLWDEIALSVSRFPADTPKTLVTTNVATTFLSSFPQWNSHNFDLLRTVTCIPEVEKSRNERIQALKLPDKFVDCDALHFDRPNTRSKVEEVLQEAIQRNQPVACDSDHLLHKLVVIRQHEKSTKYFDFAFVTCISGDKKRARIIWLTMPSDTICAKPNKRTNANGGREACYPILNELFFSNDCNCYTVSINDIVGVYSINTPGRDAQKSDFFVQMLYLKDEEAFIAVQDTQQLFMACTTACMRRHTPVTATDTTSRRSTNPKRWEDRSDRVKRHDKKLPNLSLFSGCGLLDHGLEAGGYIQTTSSIELNPFAIRSAKANSLLQHEFGDPEFVAESVNVELEKVMTGERPYPRTGLLSAGCPCQGFSLANPHSKTKKSQRNCTLLASTMANIEVKLPVYVIIENVPAMDRSASVACSQAIAFLVALGYQVRKYKLKASDFGGCTSRERLFIVAAVPAVKLPNRPIATHGDLVDGHEPHVTVFDAISDLEPIHNDTTLNVKSPYHIPINRLTSQNTHINVNYRDILYRIPTSPPGLGLVSIQDKLTPTQRLWFSGLSTLQHKRRSRTAKRIIANRPFSTITASAVWLSAWAGQIIHYDQNRCLSLEEIARAQGLPKDYVLIGSAQQKRRQVGNGVPFCLRAAIGRTITEAWHMSDPIEFGTVIATTGRSKEVVDQNSEAGGEEQCDDGNDDDDKGLENAIPDNKLDDASDGKDHDSFPSSSSHHTTSVTSSNRDTFTDDSLDDQNDNSGGQTASDSAKMIINGQLDGNEDHDSDTDRSTCLIITKEVYENALKRRARVLQQSGQTQSALSEESEVLEEDAWETPSAKRLKH